MIRTEHGLRFVLFAPGKWQCVELPALTKHGLLYRWKGRPEIYETLSEALAAMRRDHFGRRREATDASPDTAAGTEGSEATTG